MQEQQAKIELIDLRLRYGTSAHDAPEADPYATEAVNLKGEGEGLHVRIMPGECTVLLGPSGCGKSSLLRLIAGLIAPTEGVVLKDGKPVSGPGRDRVMVFQAYTSFPWLTVEDNVFFGLRLSGQCYGSDRKILAADQKARVREIIGLVGLSDALHKYPRELSGGMKQRVAIARALVCNPEILLMDEPFGALDPHIRVKMQELMLQIERHLKTTIIFVTHDAREAVFLGDTIYISTLQPCFLKYRLLHPFKKTEMMREKARARYSDDFLRFQWQVEERMQYLIEHPETPRVIEKDDYSEFRRSTLGLLQQLSEDRENS